MSTGGADHTHAFQSSGWCAFCNLRDDGRLLGKGGDVYRSGPTYTPQELDRIRRRLEGATA